MGYPIRWFVPGVVYEITTRTVQGRYLLRPSAESRDLIIGVLARALILYPGVRLHAFSFMSNHEHLLVSADDAEQFALFKGFVNGFVSKKVGALHGWKGPLWGRRSRDTPILDDVALVDKLRYVMAQGVKEGLVERVLDWPGASSSPALIGSMRLRGKWIDRDGLRAARRRDASTPASAFTSFPELQLTPIPCWSHLTEDELRARHCELVHDIEAEARAARAGVPVLGIEKVLAAKPHSPRAEPEHGPAPVCHTASPAIRERFRRAYRAFVAAFRAATQLMKDQIREDALAIPNGVAERERRRWLPQFPAGSYPRTRWCVPGDPRALDDVIIDLRPTNSWVYTHA